MDKYSKEDTMQDLQKELVKAIEKRDLNYIRTLVKQGADLNEPFTPIDMTPFLYAMNEFKKAEQIEELINLGGNPNIKNRHNETALMIAVDDNGCESVVPWVMIDCGLESLDDQDIWGNTALMRVLLNPSIKPKRKKELIFAFLDYGADLTHIKNKRGLTAWDIIWDQMTDKKLV